MLKIIISLIAMIIFTSCTKKSSNYTIETINGIKTFNNENRGSVESINFSPKRIFTINGHPDMVQNRDAAFTTVASFAVNSDGEVYILDFSTSSIKKFDKNGNFIKSFGRKGSGPGEFTFAETMTVSDDTIGVMDFQAANIVQYDKDGNFIRNNSVKTQSRFKDIVPVGRDRYIGNMTAIEQKGEQYFLNYNVLLLDKSFKTIKTLRNFKLKYNPEKPHSRLDMYDPYTVSEDKIYLPENSEQKYRVGVYNFDGEKLYNIDRKYRSIQFLEKERVAYDSLFKLNRRGTPPLTVKYKKAINFIYHDNQGRLFVNASVNRAQNGINDLFFDVFKDGVFLKQIKLDLHDSYDFMNFENRMIFNNNRIYLLNSSRLTIEVFEY